MSNDEAPVENSLVVSQIIKKKKKQLPYDIAIALLGLSKQQHQNLIAGTVTDIFISIVITVLFTKPENGLNPSINQQIKE